MQLIDQFYGRLFVDKSLTPEIALDLAKRMEPVSVKLESVQVKEMNLIVAKNSLKTEFKEFIWLSNQWAAQKMTAPDVANYSHPILGRRGEMLVEHTCGWQI